MNQLVHETSPYLLRYSEDPINWYPWCNEAFKKAEAENKPVFLSIGYSSCHWCNVMAEESFSDSEVADILNKNFVSIKVDREERPDIDTVYMRACMALNGSGGWPLTLLLTPQKQPFFAGTYFTKKQLAMLLRNAAKLWMDDKKELIKSGAKLSEFIKKDPLKFNTPKHSIADKAYYELEDSFDRIYGGFGDAPKFPSAHNLLFLTAYSELSDNNHALNMVEKTLESMYKGGIFDHIGGGFSRYSTDKKWLVPHFEKMLYDNALLSIAYISAYEATQNNLYLYVARKILSYMENEMLDKDGGFYSSQDADADGEEGKFYIFSPSELDFLGAKESQYICSLLNISQDGEFFGKSIPHLSEAIPLTGEREALLLSSLYKYRKKRFSLFRDEKKMTDWNALAAAAFSKMYGTCGEEKYRIIAENTMEFIETRLKKDGVLMHSLHMNELKAQGFLDDYAYTAFAYICLYESTLNHVYLKRAIEYASETISRFWDSHGGFFFYSNSSEQLIARPKETFDGAIPSGNSIMGFILSRVSEVNRNFKKYSDAQLKYLAGAISEHPSAHTFAAYAILDSLVPAKKLVLMAKTSADISELKNEFTGKNRMNLRIMVNDDTNPNPFIQGYGESKDKSTYYICSGSVCHPPVYSLQDALKLL